VRVVVLGLLVVRGDVRVVRLRVDGQGGDGGSGDGEHDGPDSVRCGLVQDQARHDRPGQVGVRGRGGSGGGRVLVLVGQAHGHENRDVTECQKLEGPHGVGSFGAVG